MNDELPVGATWRDVLKLLEKYEQDCIIEQLQIQRKTFQRWLKGETQLPHPSKLRQLFHLLPQRVQSAFLTGLRSEPDGEKYVNELIEKEHIYGKRYVLSASELLSKRVHEVNEAVQTRLEEVAGNTITSITSDIESTPIREQVIQKLSIIKMVSLLGFMKDMHILRSDEYEELREYIEDSILPTRTRQRTPRND